MENRTAGIIQETRKHIKKKPGNYLAQKQATKQPHVQAQAQTPTETDQELQLKASRDVRWQLYLTGSCVKVHCMFGLAQSAVHSRCQWMLFNL